MEKQNYVNPNMEVVTALKQYDYGHPLEFKPYLEDDTVMSDMMDFFQTYESEYAPSALFNARTEDPKIDKKLIELNDWAFGDNVMWLFDHQTSVETSNGLLLGEVISPDVKTFSQDQFEFLQDYLSCLPNDRVRLILLDLEHSLYSVGKNYSIMVLYAKPLGNDYFKPFEINISDNPIGYFWEDDE